MGMIDFYQHPTILPLLQLLAIVHTHFSLYKFHKFILIIDSISRNASL
jgi:hypothetical protein